MSLLDRLERTRFGKFGIPNLMRYVIGVNIVGILISLVNPMFYYSYLSLDIASILHGQVWRIFTFVLSPSGQFGGTGKSFPLQPGEDAVIAINGAIDHAAQYPQSVNLNKPGYFVCYNNVYFPNTLYHPAPGDQITPDHHLNVVIKTGQANAYSYSIFSPATIIFKAKGTTIQDYVLGAGNVIQKPGSTVDQVIKIPLDWVIDGAEVYYGGSASNKKRISPSIDAGYVTQSATYSGRSLYRHIDEEATQEAGYEVMADTNNSSTDFYERDKPSLHE